ncbi:MAG: bifunctional metallophosphatase/5'-nucleotidase [Carbonactinosporaceae bacterium]
MSRHRPQVHRPRAAAGLAARSAARLAVGSAAVLAAGLAASGAAGAGSPAAAAPALPSRPSAAPPAASPHASGPTLDVQMLALNDFHGNLEPPQGSAGRITTAQGAVPAGGAEYLATHLDEAREGHPRSVTVAAGDIIGATPLLSAAFHDEPTVLAMNRLGLDVAGVGNHEFDEGAAELLRMAGGGCRQDDGCYDPERPFPGAAFPYLAANVIDDATGEPLLPPYWIKHFRGVKVGFIGMTLEGTPDLVTAEGVRGLTFRDEVETANAVVPELAARGVRAIVVLLHEGGVPASGVFDFDCDAGGPGSGISGPVTDIAQRLHPAVDVVVTGHTHASYVCDIPDRLGRSRLVTSAASFGRLFTEIELTVDRRTQDVVRAPAAARNVVVTRDVPRAPEMTQLIAQYQELIAPIANRVVGHVSADILGRGASTPETPLGDLIADAQLEATSAPDGGGAQVAFMNPGGIRSDLQHAASGSEGDGVVTFAEAFTVQPFANVLVTMDLTGEQVLTLLRQQFTGINSGSPRVLQPSEGFAYTVDSSASGADRIVAGSVRVHGEPLDPARTYRVTVNNFLADGGDGFGVLEEGANRLVGVADLAAFTSYLGAHSSAADPIGPPAADRITFR